MVQSFKLSCHWKGDNLHATSALPQPSAYISYVTIADPWPSNIDKQNNPVHGHSFGIKEQWVLKQLSSLEHQGVRYLLFSSEQYCRLTLPSRSGIGLAITKHLLDHSHNVVVLARSEDVLEKIQAQYPQQVRVVVGDMSNLALAQKAVDVTIQEFGRVDGIVINHGVLVPVKSVADCDIEAWKHNFDVNFFSAVAFVSVHAS